MNMETLGEMERRFAELIWANAPVTSGALVTLCAQAFGSKKSTTYTMLKRLCERGLFRNEWGMVYACCTQEKYKVRQGERFLQRSFGGSLPGFGDGDTRGRIVNILRHRKPALWIVCIGAAAAVALGLFLLADPAGPDAAGQAEDTSTARMLVVNVDAERNSLLLTHDAQPGAESFYLCEAYQLDEAEFTDSAGDPIALAEIARGDYVEVTAKDGMLLL